MCLLGAHSTTAGKAGAEVKQREEPEHGQAAVEERRAGERSGTARIDAPGEREQRQQQGAVEGQVVERLGCARGSRQSGQEEPRVGHESLARARAQRAHILPEQRECEQQGNEA
jgi:hypothetical protein